MKKLFLKIKDKFLQKKIDNSLHILLNQNRKFKKPIRKVGFIIDSELDIDYLDIVSLTENIGLKEKDIKVVSYSKTSFNDPFYKMRVSDDSINFFGNINSADANEFISYNYDLLINYFGSNKILSLISAKSNAKFRVGFDNSNQKLNDIIFKDIYNNFEKFSNQLVKYLKILNEMLQFPVMCLTKKLRCVTLLDNNNCETYTTHTYIYLTIYLSVEIPTS